MTTKVVDFHSRILARTTTYVSQRQTCPTMPNRSVSRTHEDGSRLCVTGRQTVDRVMYDEVDRAWKGVGLHVSDSRDLTQPRHYVS